MSKEDYENLKERIEAIPQADTKAPKIPVDVYLQEASDLYHWSKKDQEKILKVGVEASDFKEFPVRIGALSYAQSVWVNNRFHKGPAQQEWRDKSKIAFDLKNELEHSFRFAFQQRQDLLNKVKQINKGNRQSDLIQDLSDLSSLGKANLPLLKAINFDENKLEQAAKEATELSVVLAKSRKEKEEKANLKIRRDKAFIYLKTLVDKVSEAGKYLFRKDTNKKKGYLSRYLNKR